MAAMLQKLLSVRFARFIVVGGINTVSTYVIYLIFLLYFSSFVAYSISFVLGIVISFILNRFFVFKVGRLVQTMITFPAVYIFQYALGLGLLWIWVEVLALDPRLGPLLIVLVTVPTTYLLMRFVFQRAA